MKSLRQLRPTGTLTFTPLGAGMFRCNQSGKRLSKKAVDTERIQVFNRTHNRQARLRSNSKRPVLDVTVSWRTREVACPYCEKIAAGFSKGLNTCTSCQGRFNVKGQQYSW